MTTEQTDYNGWSNRATWNVNLWLSNTEHYYRDIERLAADARREPEPAKVLTRDIELYVRNRSHYGFGDLNREQLTKANWREIAEAWLDV